MKLNFGKRKDAVEFHNEIAATWSERYSSGIFNQRLKVWELLISNYVKSTDIWLDAGCGSGTLTKLMAERCVEVKAFDASKNMIKNFKDSLCKEQQNIIICHGDLSDLAFLEQQKCNGIICSSVLEYIQNVEGVLYSLNQHLENHGKLIISVPNKGFNIRLVQQFLRRIAKIFNFHIFSYLQFSIYCENKKTFIKTLKSTGYQVIDVVPFKPNSDRFFYKYLAPSIYIYIAEKRYSVD
ncbi:class I SAM-dependent methyltransferase [Planktomarina sp.]|nr:class I SAM-dependent methyltransferase [Planktomarina sp.]